MFDSRRVTDIVATLGQRESSRRRFLANSAKLGGGAVALALAGSPVAAFAHGRTGGSVGRGGGGGNDLDVLNYALTLEHFEAAFYNAGVDTFNESDWETNLRNLNFGGAVADTGWERLIDVKNHENTHVDTLMQVIQSLGGTPVPPCNYDFSGVLGDIGTFLATAMVLENTGVMAYDGAVALIESRAILSAAATIATVEARHASYFNLLNGVNPFPAAFDTGMSPQAIIDAVLATGLVVSCPVAPPIPDQPSGCTA
jgi:hypothetical protein